MDSRTAGIHSKACADPAPAMKRSHDGVHDMDEENQNLLKLSSREAAPEAITLQDHDANLAALSNPSPPIIPHTLEPQSPAQGMTTRTGSTALGGLPVELWTRIFKFFLLSKPLIVVDPDVQGNEISKLYAERYLKKRKMTQSALAIMLTNYELNNIFVSCLPGKVKAIFTWGTHIRDGTSKHEISGLGSVNYDNLVEVEIRWINRGFCGRGKGQMEAGRILPDRDSSNTSDRSSNESSDDEGDEGDEEMYPFPFAKVFKMAASKFPAAKSITINLVDWYGETVEAGVSTIPSLKTPDFLTPAVTSLKLDELIIKGITNKYRGINYPAFEHLVQPGGRIGLEFSDWRVCGGCFLHAEEGEEIEKTYHENSFLVFCRREDAVAVARRTLIKYQNPEYQEYGLAHLKDFGTSWRSEPGMEPCLLDDEWDPIYEDIVEGCWHYGVKDYWGRQRWTDFLAEDAVTEEAGSPSMYS